MSWRIHYDKIDDATTSYAIQSPFSWTVLQHKLKLCNKIWNSTIQMKKQCKRIQSKIVPYYLIFFSKRMKDHLFLIKNEKKSYNKNESNIWTFDMPYLNARILVYVLTKQTIEDRSWTCMPWDISDCPK